MNDNASLLTTPLYRLHQELGAKMVEFAGYAMPVQYPLGIKKEHLHTRASAGLFDVSHMGQIKLTGPRAAKALERLVPVDVLGLKSMQQRYAFFTNEAGGVLDDLMVTNLGDELFLVVNAACKAQDIAHLTMHLKDQCQIEVLEDRALIALQGPKAVEALAQFAPECAEMTFMTAKWLEIDGVTCLVTRSGYTGEDGFEISVANEEAEHLARTLLTHVSVEPIGLGARDSLRLEAGLCLYGNDLTASTSPVEASLLWALSPARRNEGERAGGYIGADIIMAQHQNGVERKRVGIQAIGKMPVRDGATLVNEDDEVVGQVTSGSFGPSFGGPVAMGYVTTECAHEGQELFALVRNKKVVVKIVKLPFVKQNYYRG